MIEIIENTTTFLIIAFFFLLLGYRPPWWWWGRKQNECVINSRLIPGPYALPVLGTSWFFSLGSYSFNKLHEFHWDMYKKYGPVVKEEAFFNFPIISLFEKNDIEKVLKSQGKYPLRPPCEAMAQYRRSRPDRYATTGMVNEQGETWSCLRTALTTALISPKTISNFLPQLYEIADDWTNLLRFSRNFQDEITNLKSLTERLGLEITCAFVLGRRMGFLIPGEGSETATKLFEGVQDHFIATRDTYFGFPLWKFFQTPAYKRLVKSEGIIYDLVLELIETADDSTKESEVFQSMLQAKVDDREKTAAIVDYIAAGIHTTKNSLLFLFHVVGQHNEIQDKIVHDPAYAKACSTESFRMFPTATPLCRITEEELELGGYQVKAGSVVLCHTGLACRDDRNFEKANEFCPERWLNNGNTSPIFIPFGSGRRFCPGKRFVEHILPVILESTVKKFEIVAEHPLKLEFEFLIGPEGPMPMIFKDRY